MRRTTHTAALTLCLALAAGCAAAPTVSTGTSPSASSAANDLGADLPTATGSPTWDDHAAAEAAATADAATAAFIRKDLPDDQWGPQLAVLLTPAAAAAYLGPDPTRPTTDPANVPGQVLRGGAIAGSTAPVNGSPFLATASVRTDAGTYLVHLSRDDTGWPWRVDRFDLPAGTGG
jgi:hypothetical protein